MKTPLILFPAFMAVGLTNSVAQPTVLGCPQNITQCSPVVNWTPPYIITNSQYYIMNSIWTPGDRFPFGTTQVNYTLEDGSGVATCSFEVTITVPPPTVTKIPAGGAYTDQSEVIYLGFGPQTVTLAASAGGNSYTWSPGTGLSCTNCANPTFTPTSPGFYSFTVNVGYPNGCFVPATVDVCVSDARVVNTAALPTNGSGNQNNNKVYVCCIMGNNGKSKTLAFTPTAAALHLAHGDQIGACNQSILCGPSQKAAPENMSVTGEEMQVTAYPNPFFNSINLTVSTFDDETADIRVFDFTGRILIDKPVQPTNTNITFGQELPPGVYIIEVTTGSISEKTKVVKL